MAQTTVEELIKIHESARLEMEKIERQVWERMENMPALWHTLLQENTCMPTCLLFIIIDYAHETLEHMLVNPVEPGEFYPDDVVQFILRKFGSGSIQVVFGSIHPATRNLVISIPELDEQEQVGLSRFWHQKLRDPTVKQRMRECQSYQDMRAVVIKTCLGVVRPLPFLDLQIWSRRALRVLNYSLRAQFTCCM